MAKGPRGQKRPADAIGLAMTISKIATGEIEDTREDVIAKIDRDSLTGGMGQLCGI